MGEPGRTGRRLVVKGDNLLGPHSQQGSLVAHLFIRWTGNTEVPRIVDRYPQAAQFADCPEICELYVVPERRSQGIGTQLLRQALQLARERGAHTAHNLCGHGQPPSPLSL